MTVETFDELVVELYPDGIAAAPVDISHRITDLSFDTTVPGGDGDSRFSRNDAEDRDTTSFDTTLGAIVRDGVRCTIRDDDIVHDGVFGVRRVEVEGGDFWRGGAQLQTICRGYSSHALAQKYHAQRKWFQGANVFQIFGDTCDELCPLIYNPGLQADAEMFALGRVLQEEGTRDYVLSAAQPIWNMLANISPVGVGVPPLSWRVFNEDRFGFNYGITPVLNVQPRPANGTARYITRMAPGAGHIGGTRVRADGDINNFYNRVFVKTDNEDKSKPYEVFVAPPGLNPSSASEAGVGEFRDYTIDLQGIGGGIDGYSVANSILAQITMAAATGGAISMFYPQKAWDTVLGTWIPLWRMRAGEIIQVEDWRPRDGFFGLLPSNFNEFYLVGTKCDRRGWTGTVGIRSDLATAMGRALKSMEQGRSDVTKSAVYTIIGNIINVGAWSDMLPDIGSTNREAMAASVLHHHGTPNGDITTQALFTSDDGTPESPPIPVPGKPVPVGLIRGSWHKFRISITDGGGPVTFHVSFPPAHWASADGSKSGALPGDSFDISGGDGTVLNHVVECQTATVATVTMTNNSGGAVVAALHFFGSRNLTISDPSPSAVKHGADL